MPARTPRGYFTNPENGRTVYFVKLDAVQSDITSQTKGLRTGQSTGVIPTPSLHTGAGAAPALPAPSEAVAGALEDAATEASCAASSVALEDQAGGGGEMDEAEDDEEKDVQDEKEEDEEEDQDMEGAADGGSESGLDGGEELEGVPNDGGDEQQCGMLDSSVGKEGSGSWPVDKT